MQLGDDVFASAGQSAAVLQETVWPAQAPFAQARPLVHVVPQLPQLEGSNAVFVQKVPHDVLGLGQESVSPAACILYSTRRLASAPAAFALQVEPVRSDARRVAPAAKVNSMLPLSDQNCPGVSTRSCPLVPSVKRNTAAGQPVPVGVLAVAAMRNTVIA